MRESRSKSRNRQKMPSPEGASLSMGLELDALKIKNADLTKANIKLKQDVAELTGQVVNLHAENVHLHTKYNNVKRTMQNLQTKSKMCMPNFLDLLNLILQVTDENNILCTPSNSKVSINNSPAKTTQTVKPHTVNGTVLLRPTISLTRLGVIEMPNQPTTSGGQNGNGDVESNNPSTDRNRRNANGESSPLGGSINVNKRVQNDGWDDRHLSNGNNESDNEEEGEEAAGSQIQEQSFVSKRTSRKTTRSLQPELDDSFEEEAEQNEEEAADEEVEEGQLENDEQKSRLSTICEENEITIILPRLTEAEMARALSSQIVRTSFNDSTCSIDPQVNDTYLNMTVNDESLGASKRLRVDVTVFEPRGNSTRFDAALNNTPSPSKATLNFTNMSQLQVTSPAESPASEERVTWMLNTPSASAMGDGSGTSKLAILGGLGLCPTPTKEILDNSDSGATPVTPRTSTPRTRSSRLTEQPPRRTVISPPLKRLTRVSKKKGRGTENAIKSPIVILERMDKDSPRLSSGISAQVLGSILNTTVAKKSSETQRRGRTKKSSKAKLSANEESNQENEYRESTLQEKIVEVQRRLSSYRPSESNENLEVSPSKRGRRLTRAARPKQLKDASLKTKMRRA